MNTPQQDYLSLILKNKGILIKICNAYCFNSNDKEDLTHEIIFQLWKSGNSFKVAVSANIEAWLKTHAVFLSCIAAAISKENGNTVQLGKNRSSVKMMVQSIREGFVACKALGMPIAPANLKIISMIMPQWFSILYWQNAMQGKLGTLAMAPHANKAKDEMKLNAKKVLALVHSSSFQTPTLDRVLSSFVSVT